MFLKSIEVNDADLDELLWRVKKRSCSIAGTAVSITKSAFISVLITDASPLPAKPLEGPRPVISP